MLKVALVAPAGTVTEAGTAAMAVLALVSDTTAPPAGAAVRSVTVPVLGAPPTSTDGFKVIVDRAGFTTREAVTDAPLYIAVIVTIVPALTVAVDIAKVVVVVPSATVSEAGTLATAVLLLVSVTTVPPAGAAVDSVTVPVLVAPPTRLAGLSVTEPSDAADTARVAGEGSWSESLITNPAVPPTARAWWGTVTRKSDDSV